MSKKYGDIICLRIFSQVVVVLCSLSAVKDLLEKRGETYSDRPSLPISEMTGMDWPLFMSGMTETWHEGRKLLDRSLRPGAMISYRQMIEETTHDFLAQLFSTPKDFHSHIELFQGKFIMSLTYGYNLKTGDKILEAPLQVTKIMSKLVLPGAALVNHLPFCALSNFIPAMLEMPHIYFECVTFLHGSHTSATNHWHEWLGS
jgi:cytochrome P450